MVSKFKLTISRLPRDGFVFPPGNNGTEVRHEFGYWSNNAKRKNYKSTDRTISKFGNLFEMWNSTFGLGMGWAPNIFWVCIFGVNLNHQPHHLHWRWLGQRSEPSGCLSRWNQRRGRLCRRSFPMRRVAPTWRPRRIVLSTWASILLTWKNLIVAISMKQHGFLYIFLPKSMDWKHVVFPHVCKSFAHEYG